MINSRKLEDLHPKVAVLCQAFLDKCKEAGLDVIITSTYRDNESQNALYEQGRTTAGPMVTKARAGQSFHNYRVAFDFVPLTHGKADWNNTMAFRKCGEIAESVGLTWAGRWQHFKELAHCQYTNGLEIEDFQAGKTID